MPSLGLQLELALQGPCGLEGGWRGRGAAFPGRFSLLQLLLKLAVLF